MKPSTSTIFRTENIERFFKDIKNPKYRPLDDYVIRKMFRDRETFRDRIINANLRLVVNIAKEYDNSDKMMDYYQEGIEGLLIAFEKYDPTEESKFSSYASYWVRAKMSMLCRDFNMVQSSIQRKIGSKTKKFQEQFIQDNLREATEEEIVEFLSTNCNIDVLYSGEVFDMKIGSISSEVDKNTAASVPAVIRPPAKRFAAAAENPHWGNTPIIPPNSGPAFPAFRMVAWVRLPVLCSSHSITR